jgi:hypothetical protein
MIAQAGPKYEESGLWARISSFVECRSAFDPKPLRHRECTRPLVFLFSEPSRNKRDARQLMTANLNFYVNKTTMQFAKCKRDARGTPLPPPLGFFVSVASKAVRFSISLLDATLMGARASIAFK